MLRYDEIKLLYTEKLLLGVVRSFYEIEDQDPINGKISNIYFYHYATNKMKKSDKTFPVVICYPIKGGKIKNENGKKIFSDPIASWNAYMAALILRYNSIIVATDNKILLDPTLSPDDFNMEIKNIYLNHSYIHQLLKQKKMFPNVNTNNIHHIGVSLGSLTCIIVVNLLKQNNISDFRSMSCILAGTPISKILSESSETVSYWEKICENFNKTKQEMIQWMEESLIYDIDNSAKELKKYKNRILLIIALFDKSVPNNILKPKQVKTGFNLWRLLDKPFTLWSPLGHCTSALLYPVFQTFVMLKILMTSK